LFLAHLSQDNNDPELAAAMFREHAGTTEIIVASRHRATALYQVTAAPTEAPAGIVYPRPQKLQQLALF
jgi:hypothetical protein